MANYTGNNKIVVSTLFITNPNDIFAFINADQFIGTIPLTVNFSSEIFSGYPPYTFKWDFGDGNTDTVNLNVQHVYNTLGTFDVSLTINDSHGNEIIVYTFIKTEYSYTYLNYSAIEHALSNRVDNMQIGVVYNETDLANRTESLTITN